MCVQCVVPWCTCGDQFSPSTVCVLEMEHRWLHLLSCFIGPREFVAGAEADAAGLVPHSGATEISLGVLFLLCSKHCGWFRRS